MVFSVGGTIDLGGPLTIRHPYCTIAGQTAPGDGITLKNGSLIPETSHVIVRYIHMTFHHNLYANNRARLYSDCRAVLMKGGSNPMMVGGCRRYRCGGES